MKKVSLYWIFIIVAIVTIIVANLAINFSLDCFLWVMLCYAAIIGPGALVVLLVRSLPNKLFDPEKKIFHVFAWENNFYCKLGIRKWKGAIPELGKALTGFDKSKLDSASDPEYLFLFLTENCKGSFGHLFCLVWGYVALVILAFICPWPFALSAGLPICLVSGLAHWLPLAILRFTRPRLLKLYKFSLRK